MPIREFLELAPMLALLVWAAAVDLRTRRIPNWLTGALVAGGLLQGALACTSVGLGQASTGLLVGFAFTFVLFALGGMGGGDVKLVAGIGAWVGPSRILEILAAEAVIGMLIVVGQALLARRVGPLVRSSAVLVMNAAVSGDLTCPEDNRKEAVASRRLPYAVPALFATLTVLAIGRRWL
jgi:prepilin peptidase CpaA